MSWAALLDLIRAEVGTDAAERIERRIRRDLPGETVTLPGRRRPAKLAWSPPLPPKAPRLPLIR